MTRRDPEPIRLERDVLAALLFDGDRVYPSSPFAFLEGTERPDDASIDEAIAGLERTELERSLEVLRRPDRALIMLTWGAGPQHRTPFVGRQGNFVLAFAAPTGECVTSSPMDAEGMTEFLMREVGWAENPHLGEIAVERLHPERLDVFSLEIADDRPPQDARQMTRAAFAGPPGQRVMVVPVDEPGHVEVVALEERDLRAAVSLLLGSEPPPLHPAPDIVIELSVHSRDELEVHAIYVFGTRVVMHRMSSAGYMIERFGRDELRARLAEIGHLTGPAPSEPRSFRVDEKALNAERWEEVPQDVTELLRNQRALVAAASTTRKNHEVIVVELSWLDAGDDGVWRIEPRDTEGVVAIERVSPASITEELLSF